MGTAPCSPPNTAKWLKKVSYVARAYRTLTDMLTTPALSALFGAGVLIQPIVNYPPTRPRSTTPTAEDINATLCTLGYTSSGFITSHPEKVDDFVGELATATANRGTHAVLSPFCLRATHAFRLNRDFLDDTPRIHCECALLCHSRAHHLPLLPYIGLSSPPCIFCMDYFDAYRNSHQDETTTRGTEGRIAEGTWRCPDIADMPDDVAARFHKLIVTRLYDHLHGRLREERSRRRRDTFQRARSTLAHGDTV